MDYSRVVARINERIRQEAKNVLEFDVMFAADTGMLIAGIIQDNHAKMSLREYEVESERAIEILMEEINVVHPKAEIDHGVRQVIVIDLGF